MATVDEKIPPAPSSSEKKWPGPRGNWLLGCMRPMQNDPLKFYPEMWRTYGDYVRIRIVPGMYLHYLVDPAAIEHVLLKNHKNYRKPDFFNKPVRMLAGNGIIVSEGDFWLRQRRLSQPAFLRNQVGKFGPHVVTATDALMDEWDRAGAERTIDLVPEMMRLALRIASTSLFSTDISGEADAIGRAFRVSFAQVSDKMNGRPTPPLWIPTRRNREFRQGKALLDRVVLELIEARRRSRTPANDVLDMLLAAQDEETGTGMTDQQLKDEVLTLLTAAHDTIGAALSWAWHLLGQHPEIQEALHDEAAGVLSGRTPGVEDLPRLPMATAVFEETMRLYPPAWGMPREAIGDDVVEGYPIPAKGLVTLSQLVTHRHPAYWKEPDRFDPARFLPGADRDRPKMAYFPFGGGPRVCIGNHLAMLEGPLVLAALAQRFRVTSDPGHAVIPDATFTLRPKTGVRAVVRRRA
jgi:cytochrome P450